MLGNINNKLLKKSKEQFLERQVFLTLAYCDQFQFPLTNLEVWERLIQPTQSQRKILYWPKITREEVCGAIENLQRKKLIEAQGVWCYLNGRSKLIEVRKKRLKVAQQKWKDAEQFVKIARRIPWIWGVAISGSLAMQNPQEDDDVDFMIITQPNRLWLVRVIVWLIAVRAGKRRSWYKEEKNSWCFNIWLESDSILLRESRQNIYTAYELCQAKWLLNRNQIAQAMIKKNRWAENYLPTMYDNLLNSGSNLTTVQPRIQSFFVGLLSPIWFLTNHFLYWLQYLYMKPHKTREVVGESVAFFHPRDTRGIIFDRWRLSVVFAIVDQARKTGQKIVLATGVFDLLHSEHKLFLKKAAKLGRLVVGVEVDGRVRQMKGADRPIQPDAVRLKEVLKIEQVAAGFLLPSDFSRIDVRRWLLKRLRPDILAASSHTAFMSAKTKLMTEVGGTVRVVHDHNPNVSTTKTIINRSNK